MGIGHCEEEGDRGLLAGGCGCGDLRIFAGASVVLTGFGNDCCGIDRRDVPVCMFLLPQGSRGVTYPERVRGFISG
jgi:hypothetical protein